MKEVVEQTSEGNLELNQTTRVIDKEVPTLFICIFRGLFQVKIKIFQDNNLR